MKYKALLSYLSRVYGPNEFTTGEVCASISQAFVLAALQSNTLHSYRFPNPKRISNDLARLHGMKFLNRHSIKRIIKGKSYNKGWQYNYRISNQGRSYLRHLANPEESILRRKSRSFREAIDMAFIIQFRRSLPEQLREHADILYDTFFGKTGLRPVEERFPIHRDYEMHFILQNLAKRNEMLMQIIHDLRNILKDINNEKQRSLNREMFERLGHKLSELEVKINDLKIQSSVGDS